MPRPRRVHVVGALYQLTARAIDGMQLFRGEPDYEAYLELLERYRQLYGIRVFAYGLFPDHVQLCVECMGQGTVSELMQALSSGYTKQYNKRYHHTGPLLQERFKSTVLEKAPSLLLATGYIHAFARRVGLALTHDAYQWSSYASYATGGSGPQGVEPATVHELLRHFTEQIADQSYAQWLLSVPETNWQQCEAQWRQPIVGSDAFVAQVKAQATTCAISSSVSSALSTTESHQSLPHAGSGRPPRLVSPALTACVSVAFLSFCAAMLYAHNLQTLRQTVKVLTQSPMAAIPATPTSELADRVRVAQPTEAALATFLRPVGLTGTVWHLRTKPVAADAATPAQSDQLRFESGKLVSFRLQAEGFLPSGYRVLAQADGVVVWEALQTNAAGATAYWRGTCEGQLMRGLMTRQIVNQPPSSQNFVGSLATVNIAAQARPEI